jgi:hypothetical protein
VTGNDFMSWVLRSPLHGMISNSMMLITVTGHKTGKKYTLPVSDYHENGCLWVMTSRDRAWWKNLKGGAEVSLLLKRQPVTGFAEPELDIHTVERLLCEYLKHIPQGARSMGIRMKNGNPIPEDVERVAKDRLFIRIEPRSDGIS